MVGERGGTMYVRLRGRIWSVQEGRERDKLRAVLRQERRVLCTVCDMMFWCFFVSWWWEVCPPEVLESHL